ncbi:entericidin (plasmid) [Aliirhizobium terrae]|uniref:entericidin domain-containing protein n=1 Tax=Terrirhizobium terrae TaxID=2926709 RepID=UPI0025778667|nr:entericidin [Rhizobium sp. CC-CFT758]WJH38617.1 entericidin [Rhizobium sp. CC-CFT758]
MKKIFITIASLALITGSLSSCGNTIRGVGKDVAGTVDATQNAGKRVDNAAKY